MFEALGRTVYHRRRWVLALSLAFVVFAGVWGTGVFGEMTGGGFSDPDSESARAGELAERELGRSAADVVVLYSSGSTTVDDPAYAEAVTATLGALPEDDVLRTVSWFDTGAAFLVSEDRRSTYAVLSLRGDEDEREDVLDAIEGDLAVPGLTTRLGGEVTLNRDMNVLVSEDIATAETISLPVLAILLVVIFGGLAAAALPLAIGVTAILGSFAALRAFGLVTDVSIFAVNVVTVLGLGLAIDYGLFVVSRFREEVRRQATVEDALARTMATAGRTVAVSGVTVAVSLAGLLVFPQVFLRSMGFGGMSAVFIAMLAALTLLPALLAVLGPRVDALSVRRLVRRRRRPAHADVERDGAWYRIAHSVMRRPVLYTLVVGTLLVALALPFTRAEFGGIDVRAMPEDAESRVVAETIEQDFPPSPSGPVEAVLTLTGPADTPEGSAALQSYVDAVGGVPRVDGATVAEVAGSTARVVIAADVNAMGSEGRDLVEAVRQVPAPDGAEVLVGGPGAVYADLLDSLGDLLPWMALLVAATSFVLLFVAFGSVVLPLKAVLMNVLSLGASFGALVWIFQDGNLSGFLGFTPTGFVEATSPILVLAIVFGLSMDYEVFLMSRIREQYDLTGDNTAAVATGLQRTGGIITSAALLLIVVIGAFSVSDVVLIKMIGVAMLIAIVVDATVVRALLVPATMRLLGRANWWAPEPLRRFYARYGVRGSEGEPLAAGSRDLARAR
ncbi:putative drug exporter of the RND superfamily [Geodermatophilus dictyosporus]|uniref:Putative drug exporter of the RND superfamily n=1 Tax=Geodermatophilus dictyosporus TaxID=1523247 RepID=A0A1I5TKN6_9ACTN|nr:MMPL family transporter [Geodermatophilus dictyosporus]SFP83441.1 putative drug exporter of the RND superfamily [Geodermatophilus dictyosporus]